MTDSPARSLGRDTDGRSRAPVRLVHLGAGNFFRAHQAWYTDRAPDAAEWGYAAFPGRSPALSDALDAQDDLYVLCVRGDGEQDVVVSSLSSTHHPDDLGAWRSLLADPAVAVVTTTVTEAGYRATGDGALDRDDPEVAADLAALRDDPEAPVSTVPGKLVAGLLARRAAQGPDLAVVPCDNLDENGQVVSRVVLEAAEQVDPSLGGWVREHVSFCSTVVDRITPRATADDRTSLAGRSGLDDPALVVTEPFSEWIVSGEFPSGRPRWEEAGVRFVDDVRPYERRKLWLLNGAHSLMAYAGSVLGHDTVASAVADPRVRGWVEQWWEEAVRHLELPEEDLAAYLASLLTRFANPGIRHLLAQVAADGSQKVPIRVTTVLRAELDQGRVPPGATRMVAGWVLHQRGLGAPVDDGRAQDLSDRPLADAVDAVLARLGVDDERVGVQVREQAEELERAARS